MPEVIARPICAGSLPCATFGCVGWLGTHVLVERDGEWRRVLASRCRTCTQRWLDADLAPFMRAWESGEFVQATVAA